MLGLPLRHEEAHAIISKTVDKKTEKLINRLTDAVQSSRAEATLPRLGRQKAIEALRHETKKRKRGRKLIEQFRTEEGSEASPFSPNKVGATFELQEQREQGKVQDRKRERTERRELKKEHL